jgi:hypothetical protein
VRVAGRDLAPEVLERLKVEAPTQSRRQLARQLCSEAGWLSPSGRPALMAARKALAKLTRADTCPRHSIPPLAADSVLGTER